MSKIIVSGKLSTRDCGEDYDAIYVDDIALLPYLQEEVFGDRFYNEETKCQVSVRYLISDKPIEDVETMIADYFMQLEGEMELEYSSRYSDCTGYLWTDKTFVIGGHNLLDEIYSYCDKDNYIYLEIIKEGNNE